MRSIGEGVVSAVVDGIAVTLPAGRYVLDACRAANVSVVALCDHPSLPPAPTCNSCQVIANGLVVRACSEPLRAGAQIDTVSSAAVQARAQALSVLSERHPVACSICAQSGRCELQTGLARNAPIPATSAPPRKLAAATQSPALGPLVSLNTELCVGCTRCTRFVSEIFSLTTLSLNPKADQAQSPLIVNEQVPFVPPYSLALTDLCPAGVFQPRALLHRAPPLWAQSAVPSVCPRCATGCPVWLHVADGRVQRVSARGGAHFLCDLGYTQFSPSDDQYPGARLSVPQTRGNVASWDRALDAASSLLSDAHKSGRLGLWVSAQSSTLDLAAAAIFAVERAGASQVYVQRELDGPVVPPLIAADRNANTAAVCSLFPRARDLAQLGQDLAHGTITSVLALNPQAKPDMRATLVAALQADGVLVSASSYEDALTGAASVALPLTTLAEQSSSIVNQNMVAQPFQAATAPWGDALPGWDITNLLSRRLGIELGLEGPADVRAWLKRKYPSLCPTQGDA